MVVRVDDGTLGLVVRVVARMERLVAVFKNVNEIGCDW